MPGKVIGVEMGYGYPGQTARQPDEIVRTRPVAAASADINFGDPVLINADGTVTKFGAANTAAQFAGIAARRIKSAIVYPNQELGCYKPQEACDVIERGAVSVKVNVGSPAVGGAVYIRVAASGSVPAGVVGGFEAAADSTNTVLLSNAKFGTAADGNGVAELVILTRQGV
jgi:hypothetical protein